MNEFRRSINSTGAPPSFNMKKIDIIYERYMDWWYEESTSLQKFFICLGLGCLYGIAFGVVVNLVFML